MLSKMKNSLLSYGEGSEGKDLTVIKDNNKSKDTTEKNADNKINNLGKCGAGKPKSVNEPSQEQMAKNKSESTETSDLIQRQKLVQKIQKLTRTDLEYMLFRKTSEIDALKGKAATLRETVKNQEQDIAFVQKIMDDSSQQCNDLIFVHKKILKEIRAQKEDCVQEPLVITRSAGVQVKIKDAGQQQQQVLGSPQTPVSKKRQMNSAQRLSQDLKKHKRSPKHAKRTTPVKKPGAPVVIDLVSEDDNHRTIYAVPNNNKPGNEPDAIPSALPQDSGLTSTPVVPKITSNAETQQKVASISIQPTNTKCADSLNPNVTTTN